MAKIQLNGKKISIKTGSSILDLLKKYKLDNKKIAIEYNGVIIQKIKYNKKISILVFLIFAVFIFAFFLI